MYTLEALLRNRKSRRQEPVPGAFAVEEQWVHPKLKWVEGLDTLRNLFPKAFRSPETEPFSLIADSHGPGRVPPGNGPYFIPGRLALSLDPGVLKKAGFRLIPAHLVALPSEQEALGWIRAVAGLSAWNVDPLLGIGYVYPTVKGRDAALRPFTVGPSVRLPEGRS